MFLVSHSQTLEASFRVKYGDGSYTVHASSGQLKCLECSDVARKRVACPHGEAKVSLASALPTPGVASAEVPGPKVGSVAARAELQRCSANADVGGRHDSEEYISLRRRLGWTQRTWAELSLWGLELFSHPEEEAASTSSAG